MNLDEIKSDYTVSEKKIAEISQGIINVNNQTIKSVERPTAFINAGQSGSGKSGLTRLSKSEVGAVGVVVFDVDLYRDSHPQEKEIKQKYPAYFGDITHHFASEVANQVVAEAIKNRQNVIYDGTSRRIESVEELDRDLRQTENPYRLEMKVMATDFDTSRMRVHFRYEEQGGAGFGRYVREDVQKEIYDGVANTIKLVEERKLVDKITVYDKNLKPIYENELINGEWKKEPNAYQALIIEREKPLLGRDSLNVQQGWQVIQFKMAERGADYNGAEKDITDTMNRSIAELKIKHNIDVKQPVYAQSGGTYGGTMTVMSNTRVLQQSVTGKAVIHSIDDLPSFKNEHLGKDLKIIYDSDGKGDIVSVKEIGFGKQKELSNPTNPSDGTSFGKG